MLEQKDYLSQAAPVTAPHIGKQMAFWFDINYVEFNAINYHYGYEEGTRLLQRTRDFLTSIPQVTLFTRIFSDNFVFLVITDTPASDEEMVAFANSYIYTFLETQRQNYPLCDLRIACGICPVFNEDNREAISTATAACKKSRYEEDGLTAIIVSRDSLEKMEAHKILEKEIDDTMREGRVTFDLQPKVNIHTGEIVGAEALARQISRDGKRIYPNVFMDIMEENGIVLELDFMVLEKVCEFMADRLKKGLPVVCTSVNLSRLHLNDPFAADLLHAIVQRYDIPCHLLEFELTETIFLADLDDAKTLIERLQEYGYAASIDDFGSGYAGLNLCQQVNFDIIKLDRGFLISDDDIIKRKNETIIPCIMDMMKKMNIKVVCEGVEYAEQLHFLQDAGGDVIQGYYFSKPVPAEDFYRVYEELDGHYPLPARQTD